MQKKKTYSYTTFQDRYQKIWTYIATVVLSDAPVNPVLDLSCEMGAAVLAVPDGIGMVLLAVWAKETIQSQLLSGI